LDINVTGRTEDVTAGMKEKAARKAQKLQRFYDRITWVNVVLDVTRGRSTVEMSAGLNRGTTVIGKAESSDTYAAIDQALDKVGRQLRKHKAKLEDRRPPRGGSAADAESDVQEESGESRDD